MSRQSLQTILDPLPWVLREQVAEYVRAVDDAAPEIFLEAEVEMSSERRDQLIFIAGIRKLWHLGGIGEMR